MEAPAIPTAVVIATLIIVLTGCTTSGDQIAEQIATPSLASGSALESVSESSVGPAMSETSAVAAGGTVDVQVSTSGVNSIDDSSTSSDTVATTTAEAPGTTDSSTEAPTTTALPVTDSGPTTSVQTTLEEGTQTGDGPTSTSARPPTSRMQPSTTASVTTTIVSTPQQPPQETAACQLRTVPQSAGLDPFYAQGCQVDGFWVVAADVVNPSAVAAAGKVVAAFFESDNRLSPALREFNIRLGIIGANQRTTEMPEYRDLYTAFPGTDWDSRARGLGATSFRPLVSAGEENVICLEGDRYRGEDILLHEFAHVLHLFGYAAIDSRFNNQLDAAYQAAMQRGTWDNTYAATNSAEYWAEGVQSYFNRNAGGETTNGIHGPIDTREELASADGPLYELISTWMSDVRLPPRCQ